MFSDKIVKSLENSSWIRKMFEQGAELAKKYGPENVYDYSLGNPYAEPPIEVTESLKKHIAENGIHRYMANAGYDDVRAKIAEELQKESEVSLSKANIIMTVGAAGGLNVVLKALLNPGEEVLIFAPFFVEYLSYVDNQGGKPVVIPADTKSFEPNIKLLPDYINKKTKAIIINNPNNPTGVVYSRETLEKINTIIKQKEKELGTTIYVISDEPYSKIVYDGVKVTNQLSVFDNSIIINSFSKSLALAGERIGYIAASSNIKHSDTLIAALVYCNRVLGFVNAPGLFQKVISDAYNARVDMADYEKKRKFIYDNITRIGFECVRPQGAFYLFPKAPIADDVEFIKSAVKYNVLLVPGTGFGCKGYFRMSYCVKMDMIEKSIPALEKLGHEYFR